MSTQAVKKIWREPTENLPDKTCLDACDGDAFLAAILLRRGFSDAQKIRAFLSPDAYSPCAPEQIPDLVTGSGLLQDAIKAGKRILIWGDFDVDGQTSTALLIDGLQRLGGEVAFHIPNRSADSHGIKVAGLEQQIAEKQPGLLITCDTGISEYAALHYAHSVGLPVIITDHHELGDHLPHADAVINPRRLSRSHPLANLPGVGVAYKLMQHLATSMGQERELPRLLDLVALGIVGDVAMQTDDTRYLLQLGLDRLRRADRLGLKALMEVANLSPAGLTGERIAYQIAPRLNAAGRLADAGLSVELLTTHNGTRVRILAQQLEGLNNERRIQTRQIESVAEEMIAETPALLNSAALVLYQPEWNPGIIGIVASHLAERYARPVVMLAGLDGEIARGSARSPGGYDINQALTEQADILRTFGGHPGAAGLSLEVKHIDRFRERFSKALMSASNGTTEHSLDIDAVVPFEQLTFDLANRLQRLAPFGEGNPQITLATMGVHLSHAAIVGRDQQHRRLVVEDDWGRQQIVMWWHSVNEDSPPDGLIDIAFHVSINERQEVQLALVDYRRSANATIEVEAPPLQLEDWRQASDALAQLQTLLAHSPDAQIWAEAESRQEHPDWKRRAELSSGNTLIIYTIPPDPQTLRDVLTIVQPTTVHVIGIQPPIATLEAFIAQLTQAVRNVMTHLGGRTEMSVLCGATAQSVQVVRAGLDYLAANGQLGSWSGKNSLRFSTEPSTTYINAQIAHARLESAFQETEAYRRYFRTAPLDRLFVP
jgi:single-stranded-DNA-specific exonuclease